MALNKQMELFEGGDTSIDTSKLKRGVKEKKDARKIQFDSMTKMLTSGKVKDLSIEEKDKFVKLYKMLKQHHSFNEGGLLDEGGMIDETSGNDVPTGSTREEVRDDIPAQLSEGEFVLPADVVRFHGLEKIMALRDEAKAGLAKMEDMGQMGNSEEATLPDDMPFSLEDLDMEDEPQEMAEGGYVMVAGKPMPIPMIGGQLPPITTKPMPETKNMAVGGMMTPSTYQVPTNIATQPSYFQNYAQSTAPFQPFQPQTPTANAPFQGLNNAVGQNTTGPSFNTLMPQLTGKRETKEYRNAAGQKLFIPFISGNPIYPIPEGYTLYTAEAVKDPTPAPTSQSTSVRQEGGESSDPLSGTTSVRGLNNAVVSTDFSNMNPTDVAKSMGNMGSTDRANAVQNAMQSSYGYTGLAKSMQQLGAMAVPGVMASKMAGQKTMNPMDVLGQIGQPNQDARNAIGAAFGAVNTSGTALGYADLSGYVDDPMAEMTNEVNAMNTAMFGGSITGKDATGPMTAAGVNQVTNKDIQNVYGIEPERDERGVGIKTGTNPGQMSKGVFYDVNGIGNSDDAAYSSLTDMIGYLSVSIGKHGYYGTLATAKEQAKKGNKKAQAVVRDMETKGKEKGSTRGNPSFTNVNVNDPMSVTDRSNRSGYGIGDSTGPGSQTVGIETDVVGISNDPSIGATAGGPTDPSGSLGSQDSVDSNDSVSGDTPGDSQGATGGIGDYNIGGLAGKKKKPKPKKMKRGGLASRK